LAVRVRSTGDNAEPSGTSALASALLTYSALTGTYRQEAEDAIASAMGVARVDPRFAGWALAAAEAAVTGPVQVAVVGEDEAAAEMLRRVRSSTSPGLVLASGTGDAADLSAEHPLLTDRPLVQGKSAAYVCHGFVCDLPVTTVEDLAAALNGPRPRPHVAPTSGANVWLWSRNRPHRDHSHTFAAATWAVGGRGTDAGGRGRRWLRTGPGPATRKAAGRRLRPAAAG